MAGACHISFWEGGPLFFATSTKTLFNTQSTFCSIIYLLQDEADRLFLNRFEVIISKGEFAAKTHIKRLNDYVLGCKMRVRIGSHRERRQTNNVGGLVVNVLAYAAGKYAPFWITCDV